MSRYRFCSWTHWLFASPLERNYRSAQWIEDEAGLRQTPPLCWRAAWSCRERPPWSRLDHRDRIKSSIKAKIKVKILNSNEKRTVVENVFDGLFAIRVVEGHNRQRECVASMLRYYPLWFGMKQNKVVYSFLVISVDIFLSSYLKKGSNLRYFVSIRRVNAYVVWVDALDSFVNHGRSNVPHSFEHLEWNEKFV